MISLAKDIKIGFQNVLKIIFTKKRKKKASVTRQTRIVLNNRVGKIYLTRKFSVSNFGRKCKIV